MALSISANCGKSVSSMTYKLTRPAIRHMNKISLDTQNERDPDKEEEYMRQLQTSMEISGEESTSGNAA
ncbi:hypothetical protein EPYR_00719 [Erwinia pyrifoliae DSM 12163]|nr:hypothetical protein CPI84_15455 [Erwinia pyrifoliae]CAY73090.1 hypothetical protein EPYR_00719 [Erwinia pyrifoliae DSM 12163]